jgi:hypothetical protein
MIVYEPLFECKPQDNEKTDSNACCFKRPAPECTRLGSKVGQTPPLRLRNAAPSASLCGASASRLSDATSASGLLRSPQARVSASVWSSTGSTATQIPVLGSV